MDTNTNTLKVLDEHIVWLKKRVEKTKNEMEKLKVSNMSDMTYASMRIGKGAKLTVYKENLEYVRKKRKFILEGGVL